MAINDELTGGGDPVVMPPVDLSAAGSHPTPAGSPFPPIADYGFLSDCVITALIASSGSVEWMCLPRMDGPSVFGAILDRGAGSFRLGPADVVVPAGQRYLPGTMILETTWATPTGWAVVRDVLLMGPWRHQESRSPLHQRAPADTAAEHVLLRTVRCLNGAIDFVLECEPAYDYGRRRGSWRHVGNGYGEVESLLDGQVQLRLTTDLNLGIEGPLAVARRRLRAGDQAFCALSWGDATPPQNFTEAHQRLARTGDFWHEWISRGNFPDHPWRKYLIRSALTLKGLIYAPTGALLAAATTSLPETPGGERNYDYRYSWLRDSTFMLWALYTLGLDRDANDFYYFLADLADQEPDLQIMYGIGGERELTEHVLDHLGGYEGARPVRIGNGAWDQRQHDMWGVLLDSVYLHTRSRDRLDERRWPMFKRQVEAAIEHWRDPDQGLWEVRGPARHFTSSKVLCWVAVDRGAKLAQLRGDTDCAVRWRRVADEIHGDVCTNGVDGRGVFCQHYETTALDAALLLVPLTGFLPPEDKRVRATVAAIADELTEDDLVLRYRVEETDDGFSGEEGTFTICSFWLVSALTEIGEVDRARRLCEKLLSYASPLLLYAEEIDPGTGRHLGNFPQAFSHLALINAVVHLIREDARVSASLRPGHAPAAPHPNRVRRGPGGRDTFVCGSERDASERWGQQMRAFVMREIGRVGFVDKPVPEVGPNDAVVRTTRALICTSDSHTVGGGVGPRQDLTLGHEAVGVVHQVGSEVKNVQPGDRVLVGAITPDWGHPAAQAGYSSQSGAALGGWKFSNTKDGVFAEYFHVNEADANMAKIPPSVPDDMAVYCADMLSTGFMGAEKGNIPIGGTVAVLAQGPVGLMATAGARLRGAGLIIAVESVPSRQKLARAYGADEIVDFTREDVVSRVLELTGGEGVDTAIEALGADATFQVAVKITKPGGTVSNIGYFGEGEFIHIPRTEWGVGMADKTIATGLCPGGRLRMEQLLRVLEGKRVDPTLMTTHTFPFEEMERAFEVSDQKLDDVIKTLITF